MRIVSVRSALYSEFMQIDLWLNTATPSVRHGDENHNIRVTSRMSILTYRAARSRE